MIEFAKRFIGKSCILYTLNDQVYGVIKEVSENAVLVEKKGTLEAINLDFVLRITEYPTKKNKMVNSLA